MLMFGHHLLPFLVAAILPSLIAYPDTATPAASWTALIDAGQDNPKLAPERDKLVARARQVAGRLIVKRVYEYEDIGKYRTWLDGRARPLAGMSRQKWFGLAMSDFGTASTINQELPLLAVAYRWTGEEAFKIRIIAQLAEVATWSPLQRPGYTLYTPSPKPVPADFKDGNWLATGLGVRALADTLEIMPPAVCPCRWSRRFMLCCARRSPASPMTGTRSEAGSSVAITPRTNQWVLPTEGLVRACLVLGKDKYTAEYELGVRNLLSALDAQGPKGEFYEGIGYANFTVESMLHAAHAMAVAGDMRGLSHPFLRRFPTWMAHHLQPGRFRINCFDAGGARATITDGSFRGLLSLFLVLTNDPVARWTLINQFSGPSDDYVGLLARSTVGESRDPWLFASYEGACQGQLAQQLGRNGDGRVDSRRTSTG